MFYNLAHPRSSTDGRASRTSDHFHYNPKIRISNNRIKVILPIAKVSHGIKKEKFSETNKTINNIMKEAPWGPIAFGASAVIGNPIPLMLWKGYKIYNTIDKIIEFAGEHNIDEEIKEITFMLENSIHDHFLDSKIENVSKNLADMFMSGGISQLASKISIGPSFMNEMFTNTVKNALETGWDNLPGLVGELC